MSDTKKLYFGLKATIKGSFSLASPIKTFSNGFQISVFIENGIYKITIIKRVPSDSPLLLRYKISDGKVIPIVPEESAYGEYIENLQRVEAIGGFHYGIEKILYRDTLELQWYWGDDIFENLEVCLSFKKEYKRQQGKVLSESNLSSIVLLNKLIPDAIVPYNYFREANGFLNDEDYRLAYLHFFMMLEYCFSNGKYHEREQIKEYEKNDDLSLAVLLAVKLIRENSDTALEGLLLEITNRYKVVSLNSIYKYLFFYRGMLAHGSKISAQYIYNNGPLKRVTLFISEICFLICGNMQVYSMSSDKSKKERIRQRISQLKVELDIG